jgi:hypothetical protein
MDLATDLVMAMESATAWAKDSAKERGSVLATETDSVSAMEKALGLERVLASG